MKKILGIFINRKQFPRKEAKRILEMTSADEIFVYRTDGPFLLTFNLCDEAITKNLPKLSETFGNIVRLHRKLKTNLLFTINAIKEFEKNADPGKLEDCCLLIGKDGKPSIIKLELVSIIKNIGEEI